MTLSIELYNQIPKTSINIMLETKLRNKQTTYGT